MSVKYNFNKLLCIIKSPSIYRAFVKLGNNSGKKNLNVADIETGKFSFTNF